jgi:hypothetical protein
MGAAAGGAGGGRPLAAAMALSNLLVRSSSMVMCRAQLPVSMYRRLAQRVLLWPQAEVGVHTKPTLASVGGWGTPAGVHAAADRASTWQLGRGACWSGACCFCMGGCMTVLCGMSCLESLTMQWSNL